MLNVFCCKPPVITRNCIKHNVIAQIGVIESIAICRDRYFIPCNRGLLEADSKDIILLLIVTINGFGCS